MVLLVFTFIIFFFTIAGYFRFIWWFSIIDFFRLQYASMAIFLAILSFIFGSTELLFINIILAMINLYRIRHFLPHLPHKPEQDNDKSIYIVNACKDNENPEKLLRSIEKAQPQILLILEMTDALEHALHHLLNNFHYRLQTPVRDGFSICLFSKTHLTDTNITYHGPQNTPLLHAKTNIKGQVIQLYSAHPKPALSKAWYCERRAYFREISSIINEGQKNKPVIVMGDFNSVPWEEHFSGFLEKNGLKSALEDQGYKVTWPVWFPIMGVPMDHILVTNTVRYQKLQICKPVGSDHFPLSVNIIGQDSKT